MVSHLDVKQEIYFHVYSSNGKMFCKRVQVQGSTFRVRNKDKIEAQKSL